MRGRTKGKAGYPDRISKKDGQRMWWTDSTLDRMSLWLDGIIHSYVSGRVQIYGYRCYCTFIPPSDPGRSSSIQICSRCSLCPTSENPTIICNHALMMGWVVHILKKYPQKWNWNLSRLISPQRYWFDQTQLKSESSIARWDKGGAPARITGVKQPLRGGNYNGPWEAD